MGGCGCQYESCAITGGIFALIQAVIVTVLAGFFLNLYFCNPHQTTWNGEGAQQFLLYATRTADFEIKVMLIVTVFLNGMWFISSIVMLIGNAVRNGCCTRQWVVTTSLIIMADIVLPAIAIAYTLREFLDAVDQKKNSFPMVQTDEVYSYYILLIFTFLKGAIVTILLNTCFAVYTNMRVVEIYKSRQPVRECPASPPVIWATPTAMFPFQQPIMGTFVNPPVLETFPRPGFPMGRCSPPVYDVQLRHTPAQRQRNNSDSSTAEFFQPIRLTRDNSTTSRHRL